METSTHRTFGLDAVRCLAILLVVACHGSLMMFPWFGWRAPLPVVYCGTYGVTLFFALSGFLIGRILIRLVEQRAGWRDWLVFMRRRWARTLPSYFIWLAILAVLWPPQPLDPHAYARLGQALPWFVTLTQNLVWPMRSDWFGASWSLTVEEWFYLLFSAALLAGAGVLGPRRGVWLVLGAFLVVPLTLRALLPGCDGGAIRSDSGIVAMRLDAAAYGVLMAWLTPRGGWALRPAMLCGVGGAALLLIQLNALLDPLVQAAGRWGDAATLSILPLGFALCIPAAALIRTAPAWLCRPVQAISDQAYGIYLCNLTILEWANYQLRLVRGVSPAACVLVAAGLVWVLSWLSCRYVERPILARVPRPLPAFRPVAPLAPRPALWTAPGATARRRQLALRLRRTLSPRVVGRLARDGAWKPPRPVT